MVPVEPPAPALQTAGATIAFQQWLESCWHKLASLLGIAPLAAAGSISLEFALSCCLKQRAGTDLWTLKDSWACCDFAAPCSMSLALFNPWDCEGLASPWPFAAGKQWPAISCADGGGQGSSK